MSDTITISCKQATNARIDMRWINSAIDKTLTADQAKTLTTPVGNKQVEIGELFAINGNFSSQQILLNKANNKLDFIGFSLPEHKQMTVAGDCGHYTGAELAGGKLVINGNAGNFTACSMRSGLLEINGNSQDYTGSAYAGYKKGMSGGTVIVHGSVGDFTGDLMRRGIIMVTGDIGDYCGSRMISGTITNLGKVGKYAGNGMKRGTLLFPELPKEMNPSFINCGRHNLGYLTLLLHELRTHESDFKSLHSMRRRVQKYMADPAVGGLGEILIWIG